MKTKRDLFQALNELNIVIEQFEHEPLYTVEQAQAVMPDIPGAWCKNLFLKDSKKRVWLVTAVADTVINLKKLSRFLQAPELRFADEDMLMHYLGVTPGAVTTLGIVNDIKQEVTVVLDKKILEQDRVALHPLENTATVVITSADLVKFIAASGYDVCMADFEAVNNSKA